MLHHQHPVPIQANQLREAGRMAQVPLRMPQPGMAPPQQRPPHGTLMMGMQPPQASVPGVMVSMPAPVMATALPPQPAPPPTTVSIAPEVAHAVDGVVHHHQQQHRHQHQHQHQHHQQHHHQQQYHQQSPVSQHQNDNQAQQQQTNLANTKEKTPMCLINELARFNKIQHQYRLTNEMGPAHKKRFTVTLKLGDEEYSAEGPSIKKAQHAAAAEALQKTDYKHPPPKTQRNIRLGRNITLAPLNGTWSDSVTLRGLPCGNITPTVELNALAMKRGEPAVYTFMDPPHPNPYITPNFNFRGMYNQVRGYPTYQTYDHPRRRQGPLYPQFDAQRYHYGKQPGYAPMFFVSLRVGVREYFGEGPTAQAARHDAAAKALSELKVLPVPEDNIHVQENGNAELDPNAELKSPISLVHEIALKRNLHVNFEVISEKGPPHMRTFVTRCSVGEIMTEGEGNGKKVSKKRAAEKMLDELKKLPPPSPTAMIARIKRKPNATKKKTRNLIKVYEEQKAKPEYGEDINPISRLIQIQQAKKEKEPVYTLIEERGVPRRREFVMEVTVGQHSCTGTGPNKKLAKRAAAEGLLQLLGYSRPTTQPGKPSIKTPGDGNQESDKNRKVTFLDEAGDKGNEVLTSISGAGGSGGRQLVPGLLLMTDTSAVQSYGQQTSNKSSGLGLSSLGMSPNNLVNMQTTATIAKELLKGGTSPTAEALVKSGQIQKMSSPSVPSQVPGQAVRPKDQLLYLAQLLNFQVQFSDFPKGNQSEFLSLVSLSTEPPQVCHGAGSTIDASHDQAALTALHQLSELGLDSVTSSGGLKKDMKSLAGGDGLHLTSGQKQSMTAPTITANGAVGK